MLKIKSQIKTLGLVAALGLLSSTASAVPLHSTLDLVQTDVEGLSVGEWEAARFQADAVQCPNGCNVTEARLLLRDDELFTTDDPVSLSDLSLSVYSAGVNDTSVGITKLFSFDTNVSLAGGDNIVSFSVKDGENSFLPKNTFFWLRLDNDSRRDGISWWFDGNTAGEYQVINNIRGIREFETPFIFDVQGVPAAASPVPVPGAVWMMGSALLGLLGVRRKSNKMPLAI